MANPTSRIIITAGQQTQVMLAVQVVDVGADRVFRSGFIALPFGQ